MCYLQQVRRVPGIFSKAVSPWIAKWGKFQVKGTYIFMRGFEQRRIQYRIGAKFDRVQALVD